MKRAAIYVRVSTQEQRLHGLSVGNQLEALTEYCAEHNYVIAGTYNDAGISARKRYTKRPALLKLINDCKDGKIDIILFTKLDRWFRSVADYYEVQAVLDQYNIPWMAIWEDYETETSSGRLKVNIMLSVAQDEADRTSERIRKVIEYRKGNGDFVGCAPVGYKIDKGKIVIDEKTHDAVKAVFDTYLLTSDVHKAMAAAAEHGLKGERQKFYNMLKNPAYKGITKKGYECPRYISDEDFEKIRVMAKARCRATKNNARTYMFTGLVTCGYCGHKMGFHTQMMTPKSRPHYEQRYCSCQMHSSTNYPHPPIQMTEKALEDYLLKELDKILNNVIVEVREQNSKLDNKEEMKRKKSLEAKLKRLALLFEEGDMDSETYIAKRDIIRAELAQIRLEPVKEPEPLPDNWREIYEQLDNVHRKQFWRGIIKNITITRETKKNPHVELL